jgi:hypothetical protein
MDFIVGLPKTQNGHDSIWAIVDRLTKVAHFIPIRADYKGNKLAQLYIDNILQLHGVLSRIILDRGTQFVAQFWKSLHKALGTCLDYSLAYHLQTDGQIANKPNIRRHVKSLCTHLWKRLGKELVIHRILLQ